MQYSIVYMKQVKILAPSNSSEMLKTICLR